MAYKTFANGFPLPASDLNNYLMDQSVIVFADSTARSAALPAPTEGMLTYLEDTNLLEVYNGSAWSDINDNTAAIPKSTVTTAGDLIVADGASSVTRLGVGADGSLVTVAAGSPTYLAPGTDAQFLTLASGAPVWADAPAPDLTTLIPKSTVTTAGDLIVANGSSSVTRLGIGASGQILGSNGTTATWQAAPSSGGVYANLLASGTITGNFGITGIPQTYKQLRLIISGNSYGGGDVNMSINAVNYSSSDYIQYVTGTTVTSTTSGNSFNPVFHASNGQNSMVADFFEYSGSGLKLVSLLSTNYNSKLLHLFGSWNSSNAITAIYFNNISGGNYELYGVS